MASFANVTEQVGLIKVTDSELALIVNEEVLSNSNEKDAKKKLITYLELGIFIKSER